MAFSALVARFRRDRSYRRPFPLWHTLNEVRPDYALLPTVPLPGNIVRVHALMVCLFRRALEICHGFQSLRLRRDPPCDGPPPNRSLGAGLSEEESRLVVDAVTLAVATQTQRRRDPCYRVA